MSIKKQALSINTPLTIPTNFPVVWASVDDIQQLWSQDRLHYPDPVTPLEFSVIEQFIDAGLTRAARIYDIPIRFQDQHINSYLYVAAIPSKTASSKNNTSSDRKLRVAISNLQTQWDKEWLPEIQIYLHYWKKYPLSTVSHRELLQHLQETHQHLQRLWEIHFLLFIPAMLAISQFVDLYDDLIPTSDPFAAYTHLSGFHTKTTESDEMLWLLSLQIIKSPLVQQVFTKNEPQNVILKLQAFSQGQHFLEKLQEYLHLHGYRGDKLSLTVPFWIEDPTPVIKSLQNYIAQTENNRQIARELMIAKRKTADKTLKDTMQYYPQPVRDEVDFLLKGAQEGMFLKEEHGYWIDYKGNYAIRKILLEIGQRLSLWGAIANCTEVFYLKWHEMEALLTALTNGEADKQRYAQKIKQRQTLEKKFSAITPPPLLGTLPEGDPPSDPISQMFLKVEGNLPLETEEKMNNNNILYGQAGSPGQVQGIVKIIHKLHDAVKLNTGDILVTETTSPSWTPLFATVAAIVTDSGGILSHSAVVARELNIPTVVGLSNATTQLHDGQHIEVDGTNGIIRIL